MTSKKETEESRRSRKYTVLGKKALRISKKNQEAIRMLKRLRGKFG